MARRSLWQISTEEEQLTNVAAEPTEVQDVVVAQDTVEEVKADEQELKEDMVALEEGQEAMDELAGQSAEIETQLEENPEAITEETVAVAQEAYLATLAKTGMPSSEAFQYRVSLESDGTPVQKLKMLQDNINISREGLLEVWTKIKKAFTGKLGDYIDKKAAQYKEKAVVIDQLIAQAKSASGVNTDLGEIMAKKLQGFLAGSDGNYNVSEFVSYVELVKQPPCILGIDAVLKNSKFSNEETVKGYKGKDLKRMLDEVSKEIGSKLTKHKYNDNLLKAARVNSSNFFGGSVIDKEDIIGVFSISGRKVFFVAAYLGNSGGFGSILARVIGGNGIIGSLAASLLSNYCKAFVIDDVTVKNYVTINSIKHNIKSPSDVVKDLEAVKKLSLNTINILKRHQDEYYKAAEKASAGVADFWIFKNGTDSVMSQFITYQAEKAFFAEAMAIGELIDGVTTISSKALK